MHMSFVFVLGSLVALAVAAPFDELELDWNLNTNQQAKNPLDYSGEWEGHIYTASPENWRFPIYTLFLDRFVNGDPVNDDINGTLFEHDVTSNQLRYGGDLSGLLDSLDYLQGMGVKGLYIAGTPFLNLPYKYDQYSPIDFTVLDHHQGTIDEWRAAINEIHSRGLYVLLDVTGATMADLIGFDGHPNDTAPFKQEGYKVFWKSNTTYLDFSFQNVYKEECEYPRFWNESGQRVLGAVDPKFNKLIGCFDSEFDQYGDTEAFGNLPDWQRQLSKFASVQDRLRDWEPTVREKIQHLLCLVISQLDIDGLRLDKATQTTVDAEAEISASLRICARKYGKQNFFLPGEITGGNSFGSIYLGRGRESVNVTDNITEAVLFTSSDNEQFIRNESLQALDAAAFHYSIYRTLTRFLGLDGNLSAAYDVPSGFVDIWKTMLTTNDFLNANTGTFDPRHMYGTSNQDVFRWPAIKNGTDRMLLALFITTLHMPGIPLLLWGEEQAFYILDSNADNFLFGRQPMSSNSAWQAHGCYTLGSEQFWEWPADSVLHGCKDDSVSLDHRDPTHPVRNIIRSMYSLREQYPVLSDGFNLQSLSKKTHQVFLPGSYGTATETGVWSVVRNQLDFVQQLDSGNQSVWLVYHNEDHQVSYDFDCSGNDTALFAPFQGGTTVKNLISPYEEIKLRDGPGKKFFIDKSEEANGCLNKLTMDQWGFKAFVPKTAWKAVPPMLTGFLPGHDARLPSGRPVEIELHFSQNMDCELVTRSLVINATTQDNIAPKIDPSSIDCGRISEEESPSRGAYIPSRWRWKAILTNVADGIHVVTLDMSSTAVSDAQNSTASVDHLMFRIGSEHNPLVFQQSAHSTTYTYSRDAVTNDLIVNHTAPGADKWRYSTNWGSSWSPWVRYKGGSTTIAELPWSGTRRQGWLGHHVILQYWSKMAGSSDHILHADVEWFNKIPRRFPHMFAHGLFNLFGYDSGLISEFTLDAKTGTSTFHLSTEWPTTVQLNVWGMNPDGHPDRTFVYGDSDSDGVLDRSLPGSLSPTMLNISKLPSYPHMAYRIELDEPNLRWRLVGEGSRILQILVYSLLWAVPMLSAVLAIWIYMGAFYKIKFNKIGNPMKSKAGLFSMFGANRKGFQRLNENDQQHLELGIIKLNNAKALPGKAVVEPKNVRRCILIATMEYDIEDWGIKIKIGGLGVMAQLMGRALEGHDLVWVVPCVGGVDYPVDQPAEPMIVTVMEQKYEINVQCHQLRNITYVLLDAPIFRHQSKTEPYPPRMDDLDSAIYYSAWNACIASTAQRFPIDIYHINDYHGAAAPLYLLPKTLPCCLSLHNAEFQGLWPMRTKQEQEEICKAFNLDQDTVESYIQFGGVFNLLHAAASYLRLHQGGFGAVGVSNKYGSRSYARYPIFWALKHIGKLPNPDPSDTEPWDEVAEANQVITVDPTFEAARGDLRKQAQEWANLKVDPNANLFVFVGRWSVQKGVDLIADVFPSVLEKHPDVQLICVGPVIDLYGKFAALKLEAIMKKYPGRVYSKPEFTQLPPYIFSGAEFALIPSRDEPFGLVAVEFGRKGALGVGARVGGLGQMPGWWFTVESTTSRHLIQQFKSAINDALASSTEVRADMRARSAKQRFPVARWVEDLEALHSASIRLHQAETDSGKASNRRCGSVDPTSGPHGPFAVGNQTDRIANTYGLSSFEMQAQEERHLSHERPAQATGPVRTLSLGKRTGPGHKIPIRSSDRLSRVAEGGDDTEVEISNEDAEASCRIENVQAALQSLEGRQLGMDHPLPTAVLGIDCSPDLRSRKRTQHPNFSISAPGSNQALPISPTVGMRGNNRSRSPSPLAHARTSLLPEDALHSSRRQSSTSLLSLNEVTFGRLDYSLQKVDLDFTDSQGDYYRKFEDLLQQKLTAKSSENNLVIEDFLKTSEKEWSARHRAEKLGRPRSSSATGSNNRRYSPRASFDTHRASSSQSLRGSTHSTGSACSGTAVDEFLLGEDYVRPTVLKRWLQIRIFDWPIYCILLAIGQVVAANSYQIVLLTGGSGADQTTKLYIIGAIYIIASCLWWMMFRTMSPRYVTSAPFALYGLGFIIVGLAPLIPNNGGRQWARNVATGMYATASASGSLFFALNFGDEGGAPIQQWVYRASIVQGIQQIYITALFYWGQVLSETMSRATISARITITDKPILAAIACPIGVIFLAIGTLLFTSLPSYYRQTPGKIPYFYKSLARRKLIVWMLISVILQNYFLSTLYGRSWGYLWSSRYAPKWAIAILAVIFFVGIWILMLLVFAQLSKSHSWILPMFAFGLLAPRWAQMWWGTSSYGLWLPWMPGGPVGGAIAGRSLWLWLGVLDSMQGVGIRMALLQTLTRIHVAVVLTASQILGATVTLIAKASAPNKDGPGLVFPNPAAGVVAGLMQPWFWVALACQLVIPVGFFFFFRKEQMSKP